ncbi:MAG: phospholipid scramblase-related protein [Acidimicrobiales bacterium]
MTTRSTGPSPANWYRDPFGRHELRYWDGQRWTEHVTNNGQQAVDPPDNLALANVAQRHQESIGKDMARAEAAPAFQGGGGLFTEPVLVVRQKAKLVEVSAEYAIFNQDGTQIGYVAEQNQGTGRKLLKMTSYGSMMTKTLTIHDERAQPVLTVTRPRTMARSSVVVTDMHGREIGRIEQKNVFGKARFMYEVNGQPFASLNAENWRAWDFSIKDAAETEVARISKTWQGFTKAMWTTADHYVVQIHRPLEEPLRTLVVASAVCVDTVIGQMK